MSIKPKDLAIEWEQLEKLIQARDLLVFPGIIENAGMKIGWDLDLGIIPFLDLAVQLKIQMVYAGNTIFSADLVEDIVSSFYTELEIGEPAPELIQKTQDLTKSYFGKMYNYWLQWTYEGVLHYFLVTADRVAPVENQILDDIVSFQKGEAKLRLGRKAASQDTARDLANNVLFQQAPTWSAKYEFAEKQYPDTDDELLDIVEYAIKILKEEIIPEKEKEMASRARTLIDSGQSLTRASNQLKMSRGRLERLLAKYPA